MNEGKGGGGKEDGGPAATRRTTGRQRGTHGVTPWHAPAPGSWRSRIVHHDQTSAKTARGKGKRVLQSLGGTPKIGVNTARRAGRSLHVIRSLTPEMGANWGVWPNARGRRRNETVKSWSVGLEAF